MTRKEFILGAGAVVGAMAARPEAAPYQVGVTPLVRFGVVTDVHYADKAQSGNVDYRGALAKLQAAVMKLEGRGLDFIVELGDFKDDSGSVSATLAKFDEIEAAFTAFSGAHYHVMGNHDTDVLTKDEFFAHVSNTGFTAAQGYYSFVQGGVKFIVLDANFNSDSDSDPYSRGNWTWSVAYIPPSERAWLQAELAAASGPVVVFCHQRLDGTGSYFVKNAAEVRRIIENSGKVIGVFAGHEHAGGRNCTNGVSYYTLKSLAEQGKCFEVACYPNGLSVFGHGFNE